LIDSTKPGKVVFSTKPFARRSDMPINQLYDTWQQRIRQLRPNQRITQVRSFVWLVIGIHQSRSVHLSKVAGKIPGKARLLSVTRRMGRLLDNPAIRVREWYEPIARRWMEEQLRRIGEIRLIVDGTKIGFGHQLLIVTKAYRKRAIPIAWTWVKSSRGHSSSHKQKALLAYVHGLIPKAAGVFLVGDCEFGSIAIMRQLDAWGWFYALRQKSDTHVWLDEGMDWKDFGSFVHQPGVSIWLGKGYLTEKEIYPVHLLAHWKVGEKEPWLLATNLPDRTLTLRFYKRRAWIEEMFGDMKRHGFDIESTHLRHFLRLSRLTLAVVLLYVWFVSEGTKTIHVGLRHLVDRNDRRDLCIFQIGLRFIDRCLINSLSFRIRFCSYR
jgi:hypothetical protein